MNECYCRVSTRNAAVFILWATTQFTDLQPRIQHYTTKLIYRCSFSLVVVLDSFVPTALDRESISGILKDHENDEHLSIYTSCAEHVPISFLSKLLP